MGCLLKEAQACEFACQLYSTVAVTFGEKCYLQMHASLPVGSSWFVLMMIFFHFAIIFFIIVWFFFFFWAEGIRMYFKLLIIISVYHNSV